MLSLCGAAALSACFLTSCAEIKKPSVSPFYGKAEPLATQELRWSNGGTPKTLDPLKADTAPETDIIRALYEGLTDIDSRSLAVQPAVAQSWTASADFKTWTFQLRKDARWSNGAKVTAHDFVRSWQRVYVTGEGNFALFANISGVEELKPVPPTAPTPSPSPSPNVSENVSKQDGKTVEPVLNPKIDTSADTPPSRSATSEHLGSKKTEILPREVPTAAELKKKTPVVFGVTALDDFTLKVSLVKPDENFPALVAHTAFRPVFDETEFSQNLPSKLTTNGAFRLVGVDEKGLIVEKSADYWNAEAINLNRVRFIPAENSETALQAYQNGEIDVMTNATFEPLAIKLITPFQDFYRDTFSALNFYEFNTGKPPFDDVRVRKALALAIDRESLTREDLKGIAEPARTFLPTDNRGIQPLAENVEQAREMLSAAGFGDGKNFPKIALVINRNDLQKRIAQSVAQMWRKNLGIETEIISKDRAEYDSALKFADYDIVRRGLVMPTLNETSNITSLFAQYNRTIRARQTLFDQNKRKETANPEEFPSLASLLNIEKPAESQTPDGTANAVEETRTIGAEINSEVEAMNELPAIPLYFATSQTMIKPYVRGFSTNMLDAVSLKPVSIETQWKAE